jgi:hypothetical protein
MILRYSPNISIFYQYGTMVVLFQEISWMHILSHLIAWVLLLLLLWVVFNNKNYYWILLYLLQELRYLLSLLQFTLINLISCGASQSINVLILILIFCNGPFGCLITKKIMKSAPFPSRNDIFYIFLHIHCWVKAP